MKIRMAQAARNVQRMRGLRAAAEAAEINHQMDAESARRARRRAWIELIIGVPAFIGVIYLIVYLIRLIRGA